MTARLSKRVIKLTCRAGFNFPHRVIQPEDAFPALKAAIETGALFWNGGVFYGNPKGPNSNTLVKAYFEKYPEDKEKVILSVKGGLVMPSFAPDGSEQNVLQCIEETKQQLGGAKRLDIYESARVDPKIPIEVTMRAYKKAIDAGEITGVTLSEAAASTIRRAAKIVPVQGVEVEFSMFSTDILQNGVAQACKENGIPIIAYSPLGRGFLTGQFKSTNDLDEKDIRRRMPRFEEANMAKNLKLVEKVEAIAKRKSGRTTAQVAIAWVAQQSGRNGLPEILVLPGAVTPQRVQENTILSTLDEQEMKELDAIVMSTETAGDRYPPMFSTHLFGETPEE